MRKKAIQELGKCQTMLIPEFAEAAGISRNLASPQAEEVPQHSEDVVAASPLRNDGNEDGNATGATKNAKTTPWGIPIPESWGPSDRVFSRHPLECDCFRAGELRCGVACVWAWPPGAKPGDKAIPLAR